jgi:4-hydroxy-tetrahydrodipicolinate reductase
MTNPDPIRLLVHGASGRMGRAVLRLAAVDPRFELMAAISRSGSPVEGLSIPVLAAEELQYCPDFDVAVDFSLPGGFDLLLAECVRRGAGLVSGTTGLDQGQRERLSEAGRAIPIVWAPNFSLGVVVLEDLVRRAAAALPQWSVEITETHHVHKLDSPSGTALTLAQAAKQAEGPLPPIHSVREGEVIGEHLVRLVGPGETLELGHFASDRDVFSLGALEAASRLIGFDAGCWQLSELILGPAGTTAPPAE